MRDQIELLESNRIEKERMRKEIKIKSSPSRDIEQIKTSYGTNL